MCASIRFKDKFPTYNLTRQNDEHWFWNLRLRYFSQTFTTGLAWCWHWIFALILKYTTTRDAKLAKFRLMHFNQLMCANYWRADTLLICLEIVCNYYKVNSQINCLTYLFQVTNGKSNTRMKQGIDFIIDGTISKFVW